jgi:alkylhydroperoxidase family enzyme
LGPAATSMGASVVPFVQGLYLLDVGQRIAAVLGRLFDTTVTSDDWAWPDDDAPVPADPMEAVMSLLATIGRGRVVDPVTAELVRLRGARLHRCRRCQSVRSVAALEAGADLDLLGADDPSSVVDLDAASRAALSLVDATFVGPPSLDDGLVGALRDSFDDDQLVGLVGYLLRNAANKVAVAFGADAAIVDDGFEYQIIDDAGETITVDASAIGAPR